MTIFHYRVLAYLLVAGLLMLAVWRYWRARSQLRLAYDQREDLARDGWLTSAHEEGYLNLYNDLQREVYLNFSRQIFGTLGLLATFGIVDISLTHWVFGE